MWICSKCSLEFSKSNTIHPCAPELAEIDEYINSREQSAVLRKVRETIRSVAPNAIERIAWGMPTFWQTENLIHFAAFKNHLGIYPGDCGIKAFEERFIEKGYKYSKGAVQFPWSKPIPFELIRELTQFRVNQVERK